MSFIIRKDDCRLCGSQKLEHCFSLEPTPLANEYLQNGQKPQEVYPLNLLMCIECKHIQLEHVVNKDTLFSNYLYASGTSSSFIKHFSNLADDAINKLVVKGKKFLEIGSNDGTLLNIFKQKQFDVLGVEPAKNLAEMCNERRLPVLNEFFSNKIAHKIKKKYGEYDIISGNNVLAHVNNLDEIFDGFKLLLCKDGIIVFEVSYFQEVLKGKLFDTIYHEHLDYHTLKPLIGFLEKHSLRIFDAKVVESHGGSLRVFACHKASIYKITTSLQSLLSFEEKNILSKNILLSFFEEVHLLKEQLNIFIEKMLKQRKTIGAYGAPAKLTTFCYQFGLDNKKLSFVIDDSEIKQGLYTPGKKIPIVPFDSVNFDNLDVLIITAWNFSHILYPKAKEKMKNGSFIIVPLPELKIYKI